MTMSELKLTALNVYPVKSCGGLALEQGRLTTRGLPYDREWMVVRSDGMFVTQRECPALALVRPSLTSESLELRMPGQPELRVELAIDITFPALRRVVIWEREILAVDQGAEAAGWFSTIVGAPVRLVRFHPKHRRLSDPAWTEGVEVENTFSDGFPLLVTAEESLADLQARVGSEVIPMDRFRPNVVIAGGEPFEEDRIRSLHGDGIELRLVKPCTRCRITTTDQETGEVGIEPLRTLARYRRHEALAGVVFGQNAIIARGVEQLLWVGMPLRAGE